jgi:hypothetical protein
MSDAPQKQLPDLPQIIHIAAKALPTGHGKNTGAAYHQNCALCGAPLEHEFLPPLKEGALVEYGQNRRIIHNSFPGPLYRMCKGQM